MMIKNVFFAFIFFALNISLTLAQSEKMQPPNLVEAKRAEMKKLERMVGQWSGSGWMQRGKEKESFTGTETVQRKLDGLAILIEGNFKDKDGVVVHETLAVLSPNLKTKNYDFRTYLANGMSGEQVFKTVGNNWQWGFEIPNGTIRYDIKIENDVWFETGEISMDGGKTWLKFFEMSLKKVK